MVLENGAVGGPLVPLPMSCPVFAPLSIWLLPFLIGQDNFSLKSLGGLRGHLTTPCTPTGYLGGREEMKSDCELYKF